MPRKTNLPTFLKVAVKIAGLLEKTDLNYGDKVLSLKTAEEVITSKVRAGCEAPMGTRQA